jgi:hypothetical protein
MRLLAVCLDIRSARRREWAVRRSPSQIAVGAEGLAHRSRESGSVASGTAVRAARLDGTSPCPASAGSAVAPGARCDGTSIRRLRRYRWRQRRLLKPALEQALRTAALGRKRKPPGELWRYASASLAGISHVPADGTPVGRAVGDRALSAMECVPSGIVGTHRPAPARLIHKAHHKRVAATVEAAVRRKAARGTCGGGLPRPCQCRRCASCKLAVGGSDSERRVGVVQCQAWRCPCQCEASDTRRKLVDRTTNASAVSSTTVSRTRNSAVMRLGARTCSIHLALAERSCTAPHFGGKAAGEVLCHRWRRWMNQLSR